MKRFHSKGAFSLIEVLVVIAIIGILMAIVGTVYARSKAVAVRQTCQSNLMNWSRAFFLYTADYDDVYPRRASRRIAGPFEWANEFSTYVGHRTGPKCPDVPDSEVRDYMVNPKDGTRPYIGYAMNSFIPDGLVVAHPESNVLLFTEVVAIKQIGSTWRSKVHKNYLGSLDYIDIRGSCNRISNDPQYPCGHFRWGATRHQGGANVSYLDGHLKWHRPAEFRLQHVAEIRGVFRYTGPQDGPRFHEIEVDHK